MSLLPNIRVASFRAARLSSCSGSGSLVNKSKSNCLSPQPPLLVQSAVSISGKAKYEEWPKPEPWDYMKKGYRSWRSWYEGTLKRFDENSAVIFVDGLPGVGKEDLAKNLAEEFNMRYFPGVTMDYKYITGYGFDLRTLDHKLPPEVRSYDEKSFLQFPKDKRMISMELDMFGSTLSQYIDALAHLFNTGQGVVLTSNPFTHFAFMEGCFKAGYIDRHELRNLFGKLRDNALGELLKPHLILYLDTPISVVHDKMRARGKGEEKVMTREFLEAMESWYKTRFFKDIEVNSEVLVYDWAEPGDFEVVVEDIERIDFDRYNNEARHPKYKDWRFEMDIVACEARWKYTMNKFIIMNCMRVMSHQFPRMLFEQDDIKKLRDVYHNAPGFTFNYGFNPDQGDNVLWKSKQEYPAAAKNTNVENYVP